MTMTRHSAVSLPENVTQVKELAIEYHANGLVEYCDTYIAKNLEAVKAVMEHDSSQFLFGRDDTY
jgi:hypothetical protein